MKTKYILIIKFIIALIVLFIGQFAIKQNAPTPTSESTKNIFLNENSSAIAPPEIPEGVSADQW